MSTLFDIGQSSTWEPLQVELWSHTGQRLGYVGKYDSMTFTYADRGADTAILVLPLDSLSAQLVPCDGTVLVGMRYNGTAHITTPVKAEVEAGDTPDQAMVKITTAGGWTLLDGQRVPPSLGSPLLEQTSEKWEIKGNLETVIKTLITVGVQRTGHPVYVLPDQKRGPEVEATGSWDTVAQAVDTLLVKNGYRLDLSGWLPGDQQPDGAALRTPYVIADVVPYTAHDGLVWTVESGDIVDWSVTHTRATTTRGTVGYEIKDQAQRRYLSIRGEESASPWSVRDSFVEYTDHKEIDDRQPDPYVVARGMEAEGDDRLAKGAPSFGLSVKVDVGNTWQFKRGSLEPRTFDLGHYADIYLPVLGYYRQVITEVELHVTPNSFSVTPTVSTPDTLDTDMFSAVATLAQRLDKMERT